MGALLRRREALMAKPVLREAEVRFSWKRVEDAAVQHVQQTDLAARAACAAEHASIAADIVDLTELLMRNVAAD